MSLNPPLVSLLLLPLAIAAFLLPGWILNRRLGSPAPELTIFLGSAAFFFLFILICVVCQIPLTRGPLLAGWAAVNLFLACWAWRIPTKVRTGAYTMRWPKSVVWVWMSAAGLGLLSITLRAVLDPLSGYDNGFRWDYLARATFAYGRLDFYPPVTTSDFDIYSWCDGIPPLVSSLNFWIYLFTNSIAPSLTAARVGIEAVLVFCAVARLVREFWGENGVGGAVATAASSSLLLWAIAMVQETGLTTLTLAAMMFLLLVRQRTQSSSAVLWAGVAAGCGALSREYGLAFILFGAVLLLVRRDLRGSRLFFLTAGIISVPWYLRNWVVTGNPVFPQTLGGLFPQILAMPRS